MPRPAVQLYTLRELDRSLADIIELIADLGYEGVEFSHAVSGGIPGSEVKSALDRVGIEPIAAHVDMDALQSRLDDITDYYETIGSKAIVIPHLSRSHFLTDRRIRRLARELERVGTRLANKGFTLHYHNSTHEFARVDHTLVGRALRTINPAFVAGSGFTDQTIRRIGVVNDFIARCLGLERVADRLEDTGFYRLSELVAPDLMRFEVDVGGVTVAGFDPLGVIAHLGSRTTMIHMHDVRISDPSPWARKHSANPGSGNVPFPDIAELAAELDIEWLVFEHDDPADPIETLERGAVALGCA